MISNSSLINVMKNCFCVKFHILPVRYPHTLETKKKTALIE